jgi:hypothetical protein
MVALLIVTISDADAERCATCSSDAHFNSHGERMSKCKPMIDGLCRCGNQRYSFAASTVIRALREATKLTMGRSGVQRRESK